MLLGMEVSERLTRWISGAFPEDRERVLELLRSIPEPAYGGQDAERVQASLVVRAGGRWRAVQVADERVRLDFRDALVAGGLADGEWAMRLNDLFGEDGSHRYLDDPRSC